MPEKGKFVQPCRKNLLSSLRCHLLNVAVFRKLQKRLKSLTFEIAHYHLGQISMILAVVQKQKRI